MSRLDIYKAGAIGLSIWLFEYCALFFVWGFAGEGEPDKIVIWPHSPAGWWTAAGGAALFFVVVFLFCRSRSVRKNLIFALVAWLGCGVGLSAPAFIKGLPGAFISPIFYAQLTAAIAGALLGSRFPKHPPPESNF